MLLYSFVLKLFKAFFIWSVQNKYNLNTVLKPQ